MNIFITLLENVNKSRTSANNLSLTQNAFNKKRFFWSLEIRVKRIPLYFDFSFVLNITEANKSVKVGGVT
jgi:hypothetical protein